MTSTSFSLGGGIMEGFFTLLARHHHHHHHPALLLLSLVPRRRRRRRIKEWKRRRGITLGGIRFHYTHWSFAVKWSHRAIECFTVWDKRLIKFLNVNSVSYSDVFCSQTPLLTASTFFVGWEKQDEYEDNSGFVNRHQPKARVPFPFPSLSIPSYSDSRRSRTERRDFSFLSYHHQYSSSGSSYTTVVTETDIRISFHCSIHRSQFVFLHSNIVSQFFKREWYRFKQ